MMLRVFLVHYCDLTIMIQHIQELFSSDLNDESCRLLDNHVKRGNPQVQPERVYVTERLDYTLWK